MTVNPRDYDLDELRGFEPGAAEPPGRDRGVRRSDEVLRAGHYRELLLLQSSAPPDRLEKPYLDTLPRTHAGEREAFEWLEFLASKGGFKRTLKALRYYRAMGWLTESVASGLREYLDGIDETNPAETTEFDQSDHILSLVYIARLAAR